MTQGNNPKNKNPKQSGGSGNKSGDTRSTGEQKRSTSNVDRPFTAKSRVRSGSRSTAESESRSTGGGASSRAAERKQEREQERQRRRFTIGGIVIGAVVLLVVFALLITTIPADAPVPENAVARYADIDQSETQEGYPVLGDANSPVRVSVYSSFDCTHCREFHEGYQQALVDRVKAGSMSLIFVPLYGTGSVTNGEGAVRASMCALQQGKFWEFQDALFNWQGLYVNQAFTSNRLQAGAGSLNVDLRNGCINSTETSEVLSTARTAASGLLNFAGTPSVTINGVVPTDAEGVPLTDRDAIIAAIDAEIARLGGAEATPEATSEATAEAIPEAVATEPAVAATPEVTPDEVAEPTPEVTPAS